MVSKARDDLPDPETPVTTVRELWGISKSIFFKLWTRAPRTTMVSVDIFWAVRSPGSAVLATGGFRSTGESLYYNAGRAGTGWRELSRIGRRRKKEEKVNSTGLVIFPRRASTCSSRACPCPPPRTIH